MTINYGYYFYDESDVKYYESKLSDLDPNNVSDLSDYIDYKKNIEINKSSQKL